MSAVAQGADITLEKTLSENVITEGDNVTVEITLINNMDKEIKGQLTDWYPRFAGIEGYYAKIEKPGGGVKPMPEWDITLKPLEKKEITYYLHFERIPTNLNDKKYTIHEAVFYSDGYVYPSGDISVYITGLSVPEKGCNYNFVCEPQRGENFGNCPQDCSSSGKDNYCNPIGNVVCDPDCEPGQDPDCEEGATTTIITATSSTTVPPVTTLPPEKPEDNGGYLIYLIALLIILPTAFLIYRKTKTGEIKKEKKELEVKEWVKKNLRDGEDPEALKEILREGGYDPKIVDELTKKLYG